MIFMLLEKKSLGREKEKKVYKDDLLIVNDDNLTILVDNIKIRLDVIDNKVRIFSITKNNSKIDYEVY